MAVEEKCKAEASSNSIQIQVGLFSSIWPEFQVVSLQFTTATQHNRCMQRHFIRARHKQGTVYIQSRRVSIRCEIPRTANST